MTAREAAWRPAPGRHSVWELAVHAAYWKYAVRRLLTGEKRGSFPFPGSNWFPRPAGDPSDAAFKADLAVLAQQHRLLVQAVSQVRPADLEKKAPGSKYTRSRLIQGVGRARPLPRRPDPAPETPAALAPALREGAASARPRLRARDVQSLRASEGGASAARSAATKVRPDGKRSHGSFASAMARIGIHGLGKVGADRGRRGRELRAR